MILEGNRKVCFFYCPFSLFLPFFFPFSMCNTHLLWNLSQMMVFSLFVSCPPAIFQTFQKNYWFHNRIATYVRGTGTLGQNWQGGKYKCVQSAYFMLICRCFLLHKDMGNHVELALLTPFCPSPTPQLCIMLDCCISLQPRACIILEAPSLGFVPVWNPTLGPGTGGPWVPWWHTLTAWGIGQLCTSLELLDFRAWVKQAPAQGALEPSAVNRNWCWFGNEGEDCNKVCVWLQKVSAWSKFGKRAFSLAVQRGDTILVAHFGWGRIWPSCLWAAAELAP